MKLGGIVTVGHHLILLDLSLHQVKNARHPIQSYVFGNRNLCMQLLSYRIIIHTLCGYELADDG